MVSSAKSFTVEQNMNIVREVNIGQYSQGGQYCR